MCCSISLLLICLTCPMGRMTLSSKVERIHQSILYSALKITSAEGKKEMVLEMEISPFLSLYFLSF